MLKLGLYDHLKSRNCRGTARRVCLLTCNVGVIQTRKVWWGWRSGTKKKNDGRVDELIEDKTSDTMYRWIHESKILAINMNRSCRLLPKRVSESTEWFACLSVQV
jgi:hypothetical protein